MKLEVTVFMNVERNFLLSVVVPTRNRQIYAIKTIKQILNIMNDKVQVVVSDNSDNDNLKFWLDEINDFRVKYRYIDKRIPGVENYATGIELSDGEYICCIGDDDGVLKEIFDVVQWAHKNNVKAIKPGVQASYIWPNTVELYKTGCLSLGDFNEMYKYVDTKEELLKFLKSGCVDFPEAQLVKAYHGIVHRDVYYELKKRTGHYCGGLSPDIYLSVALSLITDQVLCLNIPLTIFGACKQSTTGDSLNKINVGKLQDAPHFIGQPYEWSDKVPKFYCGMNIWADSAMHALADMGAQDMLQIFSIEHLSSYLILHYKQYLFEIRENFRLNNGDINKLNFIIKKEKNVYKRNQIKLFLKNNPIIFELYKKIRDKYRSVTNKKTFSINGVGDIDKAVNIVADSIRETFSKLMSNLG